MPGTVTSGKKGTGMPNPKKSKNDTNNPSSGEFESSNHISGPLPQMERWSRAGEEHPGGLTILEDGSINIKRFSIGPETELELSWWNKKLMWEVRREPTDHRVVVGVFKGNIWRVHLIVATVIIVTACLGMVVFAGLPLLFGAVTAAVLAALGYGALVWEQRSTSFDSRPELLVEMDSFLWSGVRELVLTKHLAETKAGQERRYNEALSIARRMHDEKYGVAATDKHGEPILDKSGNQVYTVGKTYADGNKILKVPKFVIPKEFTAQYLDESKRLSSDQVYEAISSLLSPNKQANLRAGLVKRYHAKPELALAAGRGVSQCECVACEVNAELGVVPELSGAEAARNKAIAAAKRKNKNRRENSGIAGLRKTAEQKDAEKVDKARKAVAASDRKRAAEEAASHQIEEEAPAPSRKNAGSWVIVFIGFVVTALIVGGVSLVLLASGDEREGSESLELPPTSEPSTPPSTSAEPTTEAPPARGEVPGRVINYEFGDPGDRNSGAAVIAAYDHAYYVNRSEVEAVSFYAPGVRPEPEELRDIIASQPQGTRYALAITPVVPGSEYDVVLTVTWPGYPPEDFNQKFFTTYSDGEFFILRVE